ncbi:MAG: glycosyltransferase [Anaerolineae bacterium]|nr:glycosyltransferase [Anaerolineae bacterium]
MRVALVHDWLNQVGGAEDVLESLVSIFPDAPVYTSIYWRDRMPAYWQEWDIRTTFLDGFPRIYKRQQLYLPLFPLAFEQFDFSDYDLVISNKSGFAHGIITPPHTLHICYCLTPTRYLWRYQQYAAQERLSRTARLILAPFLNYLRLWDRLAADRVDHFIAISREIRRRIAKYYRRDSAIIYPPVDLDRFDVCRELGDYYLFVGRLLPYRRLDVLIEAFNALDRPLMIAGSGRDRERLERLAGPSVTFLGYVDGSDLPDLMARSRAFVWPGDEDFGIAPIQAMAAGRPVIAYAAGGALDTVVPGTGAMFAAQTPEAIIKAVEAFDDAAVDPAFIRAHAAQFDNAVFRQRILGFIEKQMESHQRG